MARRGGEPPKQDNEAVVKMNHRGGGVRDNRRQVVSGEEKSVENFLSESAEPMPVGEGQRSQPFEQSPGWRNL